MLLGAMIALAIAHQFVPHVVAAWAAGIAGWLAAPLLIGRISGSQRIQVAILGGAGILALLWASGQGAAAPVADVIAKNHGLLSMLGAVSFLRLVAIVSNGAAGPDKLPVGERAFAGTLASLALFGSVINISSLMLIADRLQDAKQLTRFAARSLTRIFSGCSAWSPFYGGMAVVITYVSTASLGGLMAWGLPFAIIGLGFTWLLARTFDREAVNNFAGYPMDLRNLWLPVVLATTVFAVNRLLPGISILVHIAIGALLVSAGTLIRRNGITSTLRQMWRHVLDGLPGMAGELYLFLAAGLLAVGLHTALSTTGFRLPIEQFDATVAALVLGMMVLLSAIGVHPVIPISTLTPFLVPLNPPPDLLALTYMFGWSLGTCGSPLSGTHIIVQARYGVPSWQAAISNWPFVIIMYVVAVALLFVRGV